MFKKFKDKLGEELKQSPLRISASVQQIAQAISPSPSASSLQEPQTAVPLPDALTVSSDFFSIGDDQDSADSNKTLHHVDLTSSSPSILPSSRSRRSSISSVASDVSSLFPIYESPLSHSFLQSECESELEDGAASQLEKISKEQLYQGYKKLLYRYNKYKGRFVDLSKVYKDLQYDNMKTKNVLQESQDKALRRVAELREQCQLEQKAKAHLEESLRNDLEERDHIIATLNTKIGLLKGNGVTVDHEEPLISPLVPVSSNASLQDTDSIEFLRTQNQELTSKVDKLTKLISSHSLANNVDPISTEQVKEKITELKSGIVRMKSDNESISNLLSKSPPTSEFGDDSGTLIDFSSPESDERDKKIEKLNNLLLKCKEKIGNLNMEIRKRNTEVQDLTDSLNSSKTIIDKLNADIVELKRVGEENNLTIAENKMAIHQELETKELQIRSLTKDLQDTKNEVASTKAQLSELESKHVKDIKENERQRKELEDALSKANSAPIVQNNGIDKETLDKEKQRLNTELESLIRIHQDRLETVIEKVNSRIVTAEGNISRICADRLISSRSNEMDLLQQIARLENQVQEGGITQVRSEDLEKEIQSLQESVIEKQKRIDEDSEMISKLNEELNEKIDRIVDLGNELDENTARLRIQLESSEAKQSSLATEKSELEQKSKDLWQKFTALQDQIQAKESEIAKLLKSNESLKQANEKLQPLEKQLKAKEKEVRELQRVFAGKEEELDVSRSEKAALIKQHEARLTQLTAQLKTAESSAKNAGESNVKVAELERKVTASEKDMEALKSELSQKVCAVEESELKLKGAEDALSEAKVEMLGETKRLNDLVQEKTDEMSGIRQKLQEKAEECDGLRTAMEKREKDLAHFDEISCQLKKSISDGERSRGEYDQLRETLARKDQELQNLESHLREKLNEVETDLTSKLAESNSVKLALEQEVRELSNSLHELQSQFESKLISAHTDLSSKLEETIKANDFLERKCQEKSTALEEMRSQFEDIKNIKERAESALESARRSLEEKDNQLRNGNFELITKLEEATEGKSALEGKLRESCLILEGIQKEFEELKSVKERTDSDLETTRKTLEEKDAELTQVSTGESKLRAQVAEYESKIESLKNELNSTKNRLIELQQNIDGDSSKLKEECMSKVNILKNEIKFLNEKFESEVTNIESNREREMSELNEKLIHSENTTTELMNKLEMIAAERDELKQVFLEKTLKVSELENCLSELKSDLDKNFNDKTRTNAADLEDLYEGKLKKIVSEYEMEIGKRDDQIRDLELQVSEQKDAVEALQNLRQEVRTLRKELKEKDDLIEFKQEEHMELKKESENKLLNVQIDSDDIIEAERKKLEDAASLHRLEMEEKLSCQKAEFEKILASQRMSFEREIERIRSEREESVEAERSKCVEKVEAMEDSFRKEIISNDVESGPVVFEDIDLAAKELECTSKVAVAAVESSTESIELLRQKMMQQDEEIKDLKKQHKREVLELKKIAGFRSRRRSEREQEDIDVEHEYLRNILYEYMMGKEQMVLAKVLAAIVKFDKQQTQNVLDKQHSLGGQLRIL